MIIHCYSKLHHSMLFLPSSRSGVVMQRVEGRSERRIARWGRSCMSNRAVREGRVDRRFENSFRIDLLVLPITIHRQAMRRMREGETDWVFTDGTDSFDITICQESLILLAIQLLLVLLLEPSIRMQLEEDVLTNSARRVSSTDRIDEAMRRTRFVSA